MERIRAKSDRPYFVNSFEVCAKLAHDDDRYLDKAESYHNELTKHDKEKISDLQTQLTLLKLEVARRNYILGELNLARDYFLPANRHFEEAARIVPDECKDVKLNYLNAAENAREAQASYWQRLEKRSK